MGAGSMRDRTERPLYWAVRDAPVGTGTWVCGFSRSGRSRAMRGQKVTRRRWMGGTTALLGSVVMACAPGEPGGGPTTSKNHPPVTLQIYENSLFRWREDVGKAITDPLLAANPWLTLDTSVPAGDIREKFVATSAAGAPPDTYNANSSHTQTDFVDGLVLSLEDRLKSSKTIKKADIWPSLRLDV